MEGHEDGDDSQRGMIARAVEQVFACSSQLVDKGCRGEFEARLRPSQTESVTSSTCVTPTIHSARGKVGSSFTLTRRLQENHPAIQDSALLWEAFLGGVNWLTVQLDEKGQQLSSHLGNLKTVRDLRQKGYPMALTLIGANLKTGAREAKWKEIAEKLEQSHGAVNIKLLQLE
ncbi:hypothetical protein EMCRGX_G009625 [Ephydatia muelleri]